MDKDFINELTSLVNDLCNYSSFHKNIVEDSIIHILECIQKYKPENSLHICKLKKNMKRLALEFLDSKTLLYFKPTLRYPQELPVLLEQNEFYLNYP